MCNAQESRVSTVWCEGQQLRMISTSNNSTDADVTPSESSSPPPPPVFNAYLLSERPRLTRVRQRVSMQRRMVLEDDIKEYWGFYLLRGSVVRLAACARHEGASFIVVKVRRVEWGA